MRPRFQIPLELHPKWSRGKSEPSSDPQPPIPVVKSPTYNAPRSKKTPSTASSVSFESAQTRSRANTASTHSAQSIANEQQRSRANTERSTSIRFGELPVPERAHFLEQGIGADGESRSQDGEADHIAKGETEKAEFVQGRGHNRKITPYPTARPKLRINTDITTPESNVTTPSTQSSTRSPPLPAPTPPPTTTTHRPTSRRAFSLPATFSPLLPRATTTTLKTRPLLQRRNKTAPPHPYRSHPRPRPCPRSPISPPTLLSRLHYQLRKLIRHIRFVFVRAQMRLRKSQRKTVREIRESKRVQGAKELFGKVSGVFRGREESAGAGDGTDRWGCPEGCRCCASRLARGVARGVEEVRFVGRQMRTVSLRGAKRLREDRKAERELARIWRESFRWER